MLTNRQGNTVIQLAHCTARSARNLVHKIVHLVREPNGLNIQARP